MVAARAGGKISCDGGTNDASSALDWLDEHTPFYAVYTDMFESYEGDLVAEAWERAADKMEPDDA